MKLSAAFLLFAAISNALYIVEERDDTSIGYDTEELSARSTYQVGVRAFKSTNCSGYTSGVCNHDENSCNGGCYGKKFQVMSAEAKPDGSANGSGCMTVYPIHAQCKGSTYKVFTLSANVCHSFKDVGFEVGCIVVSTKGDGLCNKTPDNC